jgi:hypothetical protein
MNVQSAAGLSLGYSYYIRRDCMILLIMSGMVPALAGGQRSFGESLGGASHAASLERQLSLPSSSTNGEIPDR